MAGPLETGTLNYLEGLNPDQKQAVLHQGSPLLILAGAGSGKTRVITVKIAYLIDQLGYDPRSILAVTFTNKAAGEMYERSCGFVPSASQVMIRTFHSFGAWFLRRNATLLGMKSTFTIYDDDDSVSLLKSLFPGLENRQLKGMAHLISRAKDYSLGPDDDLSTITTNEDFPKHYSLYEKRLREIGNADFGDLINLPVKLLNENEELRQRLHRRFEVIMVDEYQDSNVAQYSLLKALAGPESYVCVVGDDDQSIYRFRGAEVRNIINFPDEFPGTEIIRLETNYRSTKAILHTASEVVENNQGRLGKTLQAVKGPGKPVAIKALNSQDDEAWYCYNLVAKNPNLETAILYRTNAQSRAFESLFMREGIPYRLIGTVRFYEREEVKDILAFLRLLANEKDEIAFRRIINKPSRGIGAKSVDKILENLGSFAGDLVATSTGAVENGVLKGKAREGALVFVEIMKGLRHSLENMALADFVKDVAQKSGLMDFHREQDEYAGTQKISNIEEVINAAGLYAAGLEGLTEFLEGIELDSARMQEDPSVNPENLVTLITMHNTKGLEFDRVIITGLEEGLFPRDGEDQDEVEEERRLMYVAITRAREELHLTWCKTRRIHGRLMYQSPSRFLKEVPKEGSTRDAISEVAADPLAEKYPVGQGVFHDDYGVGVINKTWFNGRDYIVMVRFESGQVCQFLPKYTPLEKVSAE